MKKFIIDCSFPLRPYTHLPGTKFPFVEIRKGVQVFPKELVILPEGQVISLDLKAPMTEFTVFFDIVSQKIEVRGRVEKDPIRYYLFASDGEIGFHQDRGPSLLTSIKKPMTHYREMECLSLGVSKALDWELVRRRRDLKELLPVWFCLGQIASFQELKNPSLAKSLIDSENPMQAFSDLFLAGFSGIFYPEKNDPLRQGFCLPPVSSEENAFQSLAQGYHKLRSLLIQENAGRCFFLPGMLRYFAAGRAKNLKTSFGTVDLEWTKNQVRRVRIDCDHSMRFELAFPKHVETFRLESSNDLHLDLANHSILDMQEGTQYFLSHFQK